MTLDVVSDFLQKTLIHKTISKARSVRPHRTKIRFSCMLKMLCGKFKVKKNKKNLLEHYGTV